MKKLSRLLLVAWLLSFCFGVLPVQAQNEAPRIIGFGICGANGSNSVSWMLDHYGVLTISGSGPMVDSVPGDSPFHTTGAIVNKVVIEYGVTSIGSRAFEGCKMTEISIPDSVTEIGYGAFVNCPNLESLIIPDSVKAIGQNNFTGLFSLSSVKLPAGITSIQNNAFRNSKNLTSIVIPEGVTSIGRCAFADCLNLKTVILPKSLNSVDEFAFADSNSLWHVLYAGSEEDWERIDIQPHRTEAFRNANRHYNCAGNEIRATVVKSPTCAKEGTQTFDCSLCNQSFTTDVPKSAHHFAYKCCGTCMVCGAQGDDLHSWNFGKTTKEPNCTEEGVKTYTCKYCPEIKEEAIEKGGKHVYDHGCDKDCNLCGVTRTTSHKWNEGTVTQAPTCTAEGVRTYTCNSCKETKTEAIKKSTTHIYDHACDTDCNLCGEQRTTSHVPGEPATEITDQVCTECGTVLAPATGPAPTQPETPTTATEPSETEQTQPTTDQNVPIVSVTDPVDDDASGLVIVVILITAAAIGFGILLIVLQKRKSKT